MYHFQLAISPLLLGAYSYWPYLSILQFWAPLTLPFERKIKNLAGLSPQPGEYVPQGAGSHPLRKYIFLRHQISLKMCRAELCTFFNRVI